MHIIFMLPIRLSDYRAVIEEKFIKCYFVWFDSAKKKYAFISCAMEIYNYIILLFWFCLFFIMIETLLLVAIYTSSLLL